MAKHKKPKAKLLLKKELSVGEINDLLSGYVIHKYGNRRVQDYGKEKFRVRFEYKAPNAGRDEETMVIVEVYEHV
jgi:hypothetical protein